MITRTNQLENAAAYQTVLRAEMEHLKRGMAEKPNPLQRGFVWVMVLTALIVFVWTVLNTIPQEPSLLRWLLNQFGFDITNYYSQGGLHDTLFPVTLLFPLGVVIWEVWLMLRTLAMSANSIARERNGKNWELLLMTGANTRQIVRAKWQAVIRHQWKNYLLLAIMRIGAVSFLAMNFGSNFSFGQPASFGYSMGSTGKPDSIIVFLLAFSIVLVSAALIAALTMLNLLFTAACGVVGGSISRPPSFSLPCGIGLRVLLVLIIALFTTAPGYMVLKPDIETFNYYPDPVVSTISLILALVGTTVVDNGSIATGLLMRFGYNLRWFSTFNGFVFFSDTLRGHGPAFLTALVLSAVIGGGLTRILVQQAVRTILRQTVE